MPRASPSSSNSHSQSPRALRIRIRGQVQGVGFRPFVWGLAQEFGVQGRVLNDSEGVLVEAWGTALDAFIAAIPARPPALSRVDAVETSPLAGPAPAGFEIAPSRGHGARTRVTPDAATCPACAAEIRAAGRRRGYAFTNCTHCGPRFSILQGLPYDRAQTTMAAFAMCPACRAEYEDPGDRRFHAQPIACPDCGPRLWFERDGMEEAAAPITAPIAAATALLRAGGILALKGLGGFHLACDAANPAALARLRARKRRPAKPLALMAPLDRLTTIARIGPAERALLTDPAAPIVLATSRQTLPEAVAPGLTTLGVMVPHTPLHHLLLDLFAGILVMTSGNVSGEPQAIDNAEARKALAGVADGFLMHDRAIARRLDDGVERAAPAMVLRRGRGRAPGTLPLPAGFGAAQVLALGGQMKGAICLVKDGQAILGHHLGDLDRMANRDAFQAAIADYARLFDHAPVAVACDLHPDHVASRAAEATGLPVYRVQHHHAHLAACLGEAGWPLDAGAVAGIVLDGLGLGEDGTIWGGEVLLGDYRGVRRVAHLAAAPLPGGDAAARAPWRNAVMRLDQAGLGALADRLFAALPRTAIRAAAARRLNSPESTSAGRLFDAVAACLGLVAARQSYEGEAAMRLEALAGDETAAYPFDATLDPAGMFRALAQDLENGTAPARIAARFHEGLAAGFAAAARGLVERGDAHAVALSGGVMQNARLHRALMRRLQGIEVLQHRIVPANDGGLALGQALVALARIQDGRGGQ